MNHEEYANEMEAIKPGLLSLLALAKSRVSAQKSIGDPEQWPGWPAPASMRLVWGLQDALQAIRDELGGVVTVSEGQDSGKE